MVGKWCCTAPMETPASHPEITDVPRPPSKPVRYQSLDVLRGIAILGTLGTNVWIFTHPEGLVGYVLKSPEAAVPAIWSGVAAVLQQVAQGKFLGLLTLMFGIGLEIQRRSAQRADRPWPGRYAWRAALLLLDGALHFPLITEFDVLMGYAVTGVIVAHLLVQRRWARSLVIIVTSAIHLVLLTLIAVSVALLPAVSGSTADQSPAGQPTPLSPNPYADGSFTDLIAFRLDNLATFRLEPVFITFLSIAMFLLGAQLVRLGVLDDNARLRVRLMRLGAVALVADFVLGFAGGAGGLIFARYGTAPVVALGILAAVVTYVERHPQGGRPRRCLAEVGRMALSSYVLQNLVASALCYGWGLGLASTMTPAVRVPGTIAAYVVVAVIVVTFVHLWLRRLSAGRSSSRGSGASTPSTAASPRDRRWTRRCWTR